MIKYLVLFIKNNTQVQEFIICGYFIITTDVYMASLMYQWMSEETKNKKSIKEHQKQILYLFYFSFSKYLVV